MSAGDEIQLVTFRLGGQDFAVNLFHVERILRYQPPVPLPKAPDYLEGMVQYGDAAVPVVELGLRLLLADAGIDSEEDGVRIVPVPGSDEPGVSSGVAAAQALAEGKIDGFWANATGAEVAVRRGVGTVVLDVRRGEGPVAAFDFTFPVFATADRVIADDPDMVAAAVRAIVETQQALKRDVELAADVGRKLFPAEEAVLIADVVARDLPYYDATISETALTGLVGFAQQAEILSEDVSYEAAVATPFSHLWR